MLRWVGQSRSCVGPLGSRLTCTASCVGILMRTVVKPTAGMAGKGGHATVGTRRQQA